MHKYLTELFGVFFLALISILTTTGNYTALAPVAVGAALTALTGIARDISGAHFNPVVSIAAFIRGKIDRIDILYYVIAQVLGGILAGTVAVFLMESSLSSIPEIEPRQNAGLPATVAEFLGAFAWTMVALSALVKSDKSPRGGFLLGLTVLALGVAFRDISGAVFNPALAVSWMISGMAFWADLPVYIIGPLLGAAAAASVFYLIEKIPTDEFNI
ncbi:MAG: aquaporin [Bacteroidetes bacterium]|nr:aquaporin [Bacteroidota bacterium]